MKVACKSPAKRRTLTLPTQTFSLLDRLRERQSRSAYLESLLKREDRRLEQEQFCAAVTAAYTPKVCEETLRLNQELPVHEW